MNLNLINQASLAALKPTQPQSALAEEPAFENESAAVTNAPIVNEAKESRFQLVLNSFQEVATPATPEPANPILADVDASWISAGKPTNSVTTAVGSFESVQVDDAGKVQTGVGIRQTSNDLSTVLPTHTTSQGQSTNLSLPINYSNETVRQSYKNEVISQRSSTFQNPVVENSTNVLSPAKLPAFQSTTTDSNFGKLPLVDSHLVSNELQAGHATKSNNLTEQNGFSQTIASQKNSVGFDAFRQLSEAPPENHRQVPDTRPNQILASPTVGRNSVQPPESTQILASEITSPTNATGTAASFEPFATDRGVTHGVVSKSRELNPAIVEDSAVSKKQIDSPVDLPASTATLKKDGQILRSLTSSNNLSQQSQSESQSTELAGPIQKGASPVPANFHTAPAETTAQPFANPLVAETRNAAPPVESGTYRLELVSNRQDSALQNAPLQDSAIDSLRGLGLTNSLSSKKDVHTTTTAAGNENRVNNAIYSRSELSKGESSSLDIKAYSDVGDRTLNVETPTKSKLTNSIPVTPSTWANGQESAVALELDNSQVAGASTYPNNKTTASASPESFSPSADLAAVRNPDQPAAQSLANANRFGDQVTPVSPSKTPDRYLGTAGVDQIPESIGSDKASLDLPIFSSLPSENVLQPKYIPLDGSSSQFEQSLRDIILQREAAATNREANPQVTKIQIAINPPELGEIEIRLTRSYEQSRASITVANESALNSLQSNLGNLRSTLESFGVQISEVDMFTDQQESERSSGQPESDRSDQQEQFAQTNNSNEQSLRQDLFDGFAGDIGESDSQAKKIDIQYTSMRVLDVVA